MSGRRRRTPEDFAAAREAAEHVYRRAVADDIPKGELRVLWGLCTLLTSYGEIADEVSTAQLRDLAGYHERYVREQLYSLVDRGLIAMSGRRGRGRANIIRIVGPETEGKAEDKIAAYSDGDVVTGDEKAEDRIAAFDAKAEGKAEGKAEDKIAATRSPKPDNPSPPAATQPTPPPQGGGVAGQDDWLAEKTAQVMALPEGPISRRLRERRGRP